jgi:hypothetical protein
MSVSRLLVKAATTLLIASSCNFFAFADRFQPVSPEELKMTSEPKAPGVPAILLFHQVDRDDNGHTSHEDNYFRVKILTEEGRKFANVEVPFFGRDGTIVGIHGRSIRPDGSIANFDGKIFDKNIVKARGLKYMAKTFTLPDVQVGGIIEYYYTIDLSDHYIYDSHWILSDQLFTEHAKFSLKPFEGYYSRINLQWSWNWLPEGAQPPKEGPDKIIRMEANFIPAFQTEDLMPPENELKSRVDFIYSEDEFETDETKYWKGVGKRFNQQLESFVGKRHAMEQAVSQIVTPSDSPEAKAEKIYARVQQLRNTSYEMQKSQQEQKRDKEKNITNVVDVWKRGYGNGVEITWLYLALVRAAGIESYGVWVSDRKNYFFSPHFRDKSRLDANVVLLKLNGKDVYCDPGAAFAPFGMLPWTETNVAGLRMDKDGGTFIQTSIPDSSESKIMNRANLELSVNGDLEGSLNVTFSGLAAWQRRVEMRNEDDTARAKFLEDSVREYVPSGIEIELTNKPAWSSSSPELVANFKMKVQGWASSAGHRALLPVGLFSAPEKRLFEHANRVHPVYVEYPYQKVDDISVELPPGWQVSSLPLARQKGGEVLGYVLKFDGDKTKLHVSRELHLNFLLLKTEYYASLRNFFQTVRSADEEQIVLQPATATAIK